MEAVEGSRGHLAAMALPSEATELNVIKPLGRCLGKYTPIEYQRLFKSLPKLSGLISMPSGDVDFSVDIN
jgi:hypothetical protein